MISSTGPGLAALVAAAVVLGAASAPAQNPAPAADWRTVAPENLLVIDTAKGRILVELEPRAAPQSVARIRTLADRHFYDGLKFHRVLTNFMAQTGDPLGTGEGGSDLPDVPGEFTFRRGRAADFAVVPNAGAGVTGVLGSLPVLTQPDAQMMITADMKAGAAALFCPGVAGMARASSPDSANSQFFLMTGRNDNLNGEYTAFGRVVAGLDVVKALKAGPPSEDGKVADPADTMTTARIAASLPEAERPTVRVMSVTSPAFAQLVEATRAEKGASFGICDIQPTAEVVGG